MFFRRGVLIAVSVLLLLSYAEERIPAAALPYTDVPSDAWYRDDVELFLAEGYLDSTQGRFRASHPALRAEVAKLIVELSGGILDDPPATPSFDDADPEEWYYGYIEEAAREGWMLGDDNCYKRMPCRVRPGDPVTRAEAAKLIKRTFALPVLGLAPRFPDASREAWYDDGVQAAADHCILRGDEWTGLLRPADHVNRAEIVAMLARIDEQRLYPDCYGDEEAPPPETIVESESDGEEEKPAEAAPPSIFVPESPPPAPSPVTTPGGGGSPAATPAPALPPNLFVVADPTPVPSRQILAGSLSPPVLHLELIARGADISVTSLALQPAGETISSSVSSLALLFPGTHTPFATLYPRACARSALYCAVIPADVLNIPEGTRRDILIQASLAGSGEGGVSGERFAVTLQPGDIAAETSGGKILKSDNGDGGGDGEIFVGTDDPAKGSRVIEGPWHEVTFAKILAITNGTPLPDGTPLSVGDFSIGSFTFTTAPGINSTYDVTLKSLRIELHAEGVTFTPTSFHLVNADDPGISSPCTAVERGGGATISCPNLGESDVDTEIGDGDRQTFILRATVSSFSPGGFVQCSIISFNTPFQEGSVAWGDERSTFSWVEHREKEVQSTRFEGK